MKKSQVIGLIASIIILLGMNFIGTDELLTVAGRNTLGILAAMLILLVTEPLPIGVTCISSAALLVIFKSVPNIGAAFSGYKNPIVFFVIVSFGISHAITKVPLSKRLLKMLINAFGKSVKMILFVIMVTAALLSSIVSNVATCAVFIPLVLDFLNIYENEDDKKKTGKSFMIALPIASMIGGLTTPAGSSLNLMCLSLLEKLSGQTVTFVQWMVYSIPVVLVMIPFSWFVVSHVYKPAELSSDEIKKYVDRLEVPAKFDFSEKYVLLLVSAMLTFWILGSWFPVFNITLVAILGFVFLFIPRYGVLSWDEFLGSVNWTAIFLVASIMTVGESLVVNGISDWVVATMFPSSVNLPLFGITFVVSLFVFLMLVLVPVAPALIPILAPPLVGLANNIGVSPVLMIMTLNFCIINCFLLPLDTVPLLTYMTGYYKMTEMPKSTAIIQLSIAIVVSMWLPIASNILGF